MPGCLVLTLLLAAAVVLLACCLFLVHLSHLIPCVGCLLLLHLLLSCSDGCLLHLHLMACWHLLGSWFLVLFCWLFFLFCLLLLLLRFSSALSACRVCL